MYGLKDITISSDEESIQKVSKHVQKVIIKNLYLMMGRELREVEEVPCGNIVAIGGLEQNCLRSATLSSTPFCPSFSDMYQQTTPILRVAIEPKHPSKIKDLARGLKLLNQADPCVEVIEQDNGEQILCTAGEVHLQRCLEDLANLYAKCEVNVSQPIVPFKETITKPLKSFDLTSGSPAKQHQSNQNSGIQNSIGSAVLNSQNNTSGTQIIIGEGGQIELLTSDQRGVKIVVRARPLPLEITQLLEKNATLLKSFYKLNQNKLSEELTKLTNENLLKFKSDLEAEFVCQAENDEFYAREEWKNVVDYIISFGPNRCGPNILVNKDDEQKISSVWSIFGSNSVDSKSNEYANNLIFGFDLAMAKGPICEEPMQGVALFIEKFQINESVSDLDIKMSELDLTNEIYEKKQVFTAGSKTSSFISLMKDVCKRAIETQPQRLMAAMYKCEAMTVSSEALGKLYAVLGKRNAKIMEETIKENTNMFIVTAHVPIADSFGIAEEVRKRTSGLVTLHLEFSHFEIIEIDPYWEPKTEEELMHYGDKADFENQARKYMNDVRKRKGLFVREKLVEHSEKQRTLMIK